jgi:hypothetical protein
MSPHTKKKRIKPSYSATVTDTADNDMILHVRCYGYVYNVTVSTHTQSQSQSLLFPYIQYSSRSIEVEIFTGCDIYRQCRYQNSQACSFCFYFSFSSFILLQLYYIIISLHFRFHFIPFKCFKYTHNPTYLHGTKDKRVIQRDGYVEERHGTF